MHIVGHFAAVRDADMRGDEAATESARNQVAIVHAGAADVPAVACIMTGEDERLLALRNMQCRFGIAQFHAHAARADQMARRVAAKRCPIIVELNACPIVNRYRRGVSMQVQIHAVPRQQRDARRIGRHDLFDDKAQLLGKESQRRIEVGAEQAQTGAANVVAEGKVGGAIHDAIFPWFGEVDFGSRPISVASAPARAMRSGSGRSSGGRCARSWRCRDNPNVRRCVRPDRRHVATAIAPARSGLRRAAHES